VDLLFSIQYDIECIYDCRPELPDSVSTGPLRLSPPSESPSIPLGYNQQTRLGLGSLFNHDSPPALIQFLLPSYDPPPPGLDPCYAPVKSESSFCVSSVNILSRCNITYTICSAEEVIVYTVAREILPGEELCINYGARIWFKDVNKLREGVKKGGESGKHDSEDFDGAQGTITLV